MSTILVTGGSGFVGIHCIKQLLDAGHTVRTTVRSLNRESSVRTALRAAGTDPAGRLTFLVADLADDAGWVDAVAGCEYVLHVASPFPPNVPKDENDVIVPAREGTLRVLRAARDGGVKRVVLTSSFAAIGYGHPAQDAPFDERDWTDLSGDVAPYIKSKTIAERAAWDFIAREGNGLELTAINPVGIFGPALTTELSTSVGIVKALIDGMLPGGPRLYFGAVDVRDVAALHLTAMIHPAAKGERFLAIAGDVVSVMDVAKVLKLHLGRVGKRIPTHQLPDALVRVIAVFVPRARQLLPELGSIKRATNAKATSVLGWRPHTSDEALIATADSLVRLGLLKH